MSSADLAVYESRWRARLGSYLKTSSRIRRRLFTKLADPEIDKLLGALMFDDVQRAIRQTIRFNWHGELIRAILHQPGVKSVLFHNPPARHSPRSSTRRSPNWSCIGNTRSGGGVDVAGFFSGVLAMGGHLSPHFRFES